LNEKNDFLFIPSRFFYKLESDIIIGRGLCCRNPNLNEIETISKLLKGKLSLHEKLAKYLSDEVDPKKMIFEILLNYFDCSIEESLEEEELYKLLASYMVIVFIDYSFLSKFEIDTIVGKINKESSVTSFLRGETDKEEYIQKSINNEYIKKAKMYLSVYLYISRKRKYNNYFLENIQNAYNIENSSIFYEDLSILFNPGKQDFLLTFYEDRRDEMIEAFEQNKDIVMNKINTEQENTIFFIFEYISMILEQTDLKMILLSQVALLESLLTNDPKNTSEESIAVQLKKNILHIIYYYELLGNDRETLFYNIKDLSVLKNLKTKLHSIYTVRSKIAHGDFEEMKKQLYILYESDRKEYKMPAVKKDVFMANNNMILEVLEEITEDLNLFISYVLIVYLQDDTPFNIMKIS